MHSFPGVGSVTLIWLMSHEHEVDDSKELPRSRDGGYPLATSPRDSRMEARELRSRIISSVDMDRLREDPPQIRGTILADGAVVDGRCRLAHGRHQSRIRAQVLGMAESVDIVYLREDEKSTVESDARNRRNELGVASPLEFDQQLSIDLLDLCLDILETVQARRHSWDLQ